MIAFLAALVALLWPSRISGPLHGMPLDGAVDVVVIAVAVPFLWIYDRRFLRTRTAWILIAALLAWKISSSVFLAQDGWCVRVTPSRPYAKDATGAPHSWDVRADWRSPDPSCSAVMTGPYRELHEFPVWFFNLPPADDNMPAPADRPPAARVAMTLQGFLYTRHAGELDVATTDDVTATLHVDGVAVSRAPITAGVHAIVIDAAMAGNRWALIPRINGADLWSAAIPTVRRPSAVDRLVRPWGGWLTAVLAGGFVLAWIVSAGRRTIGTLQASPRRLRDLRAPLLCVGIPWLTFVVAHSAPLAGRMTLYPAGDDFWQFQRYAYRIVMLGYWLEGGSPTFWFQPLYRWTAGLLHLVFGDSSVGEAIWDGWCVLIGALAAFRLTRSFAGARWALAAAMLTIAVFQSSAAHTWLGMGLGEISAAGLLYLAVCVFAAHRTRIGAPVVAGVFATLGFYTRLNHLPMAAGVAVFALPPGARAADLWLPQRWFGHVRWRSAACVAAVVALGVLLFAWRTWHYTGVFSIFYGTQKEMLATIQPSLPWNVNLQRMLGSVMMVLTIHDPARLDVTAVPVLAGIAAAVLGLVGIPRLRRLPLAPAIFGLLSIAGALVARGAAYTGRFSVHVIPIASTLTTCAMASLTNTTRRPRVK